MNYIILKKNYLLDKLLKEKYILIEELLKGLGSPCINDIHFFFIIMTLKTYNQEVQRCNFLKLRTSNAD